MTATAGELEARVDHARAAVLAWSAAIHRPTGPPCDRHLWAARVADELAAAVLRTAPGPRRRGRPYFVADRIAAGVYPELSPFPSRIAATQQARADTARRIFAQALLDDPPPPPIVDTGTQLALY